MKTFLVIAVLVGILGFVIASSERPDLFRGSLVDANLETQDAQTNTLSSCDDLQAEVDAFRELGHEPPTELVQMAMDLQCTR